MGYHKKVALLSWRRSMNYVAGKSNSERIVRLSTFLITLLFAYLWVENIDRKSEAFSDAQLAGLLALGGFASLFVACFVAHILWLIPWDLWRESNEANLAMSERLTPRLALARLGPQSIEKVEHCRTTPTLGGTRYIVMNEWSKGIALPVKNCGSHTLENCRAFLVNFRDVNDPTSFEWESLPLPWVPIDQELEAVDIPSLANRSIWLMRVTKNRPNFMTTQMPVDMASTLKDKAEYQGLIVLTAKGLAASHYPFTLLCNSPDEPPILTISEIGDGDEYDHQV